MVQESKRPVILLGVDGSTAARDAALTSLNLARALDWSAHALYVVEESLVMDPYANIHPELAGTAEPHSREERLAWLQEQGERALAWVVEQAAMCGILVKTEIIFGGMPDILLKEVEKAAVLAVGRRGNGHAGRSEHLGHHFRTLARRSSRPLLVGGKMTDSLQHLLLAYDGEEDTERALAWAVAWQQVLPLEVTPLVVDDHAPAGWVAGLKTRVSRSGLDFQRFLVEQGDPAERIIEVLRKERPDALLMGSYDHIGLVEWFTGSTLDHVLRHTSLPVFVSCGRPLPPPWPETRSDVA